MKFHINIIEAKIVLTFDEPYSWLSFNAEEARNLAKTLEEMAAKLEPAKPDAAGEGVQ